MALTDEQYDATERQINDYFAKRNILGRIELEITSVDRQLESLRARIALGIRLTPGSGTASYSDMPMGTSYESALDRGLEKEDEKIRGLEARVAELEGHRADIDIRLNDIQCEIVPVTSALTLLSPEDRDIIQRKYAKDESNVQIGVAHRRDEATIRRRLSEIIEQIAQVLEIADTNHGRAWVRRVSERSAPRKRRESAEFAPSLRRDYQEKLC